jgi:hypothetical protein
MSAAPGWYVDPANPGTEHWWDGTAYTQSRPRALALPSRPAGVSPKSRTVAAILGFFLGGLGIDRFYLGNIGMGIAKLFLGWLTLGIGPSSTGSSSSQEPPMTATASRSPSGADLHRGRCHARPR